VYTDVSTYDQYGVYTGHIYVKLLISDLEISAIRSAVGVELEKSAICRNLFA
jgi:hypothetical protein